MGKDQQGLKKSELNLLDLILRTGSLLKIVVNVLKWFTEYPERPGLSKEMKLNKRNGRRMLDATQKTTNTIRNVG